MVGMRYAAVFPEPRKMLEIASSWFRDGLTSLSDSDDIAAREDTWNGVGLDRCWSFVTTKLGVLNHDGVKTCGHELGRVSMVKSRTHR